MQKLNQENSILTLQIFYLRTLVAIIYALNPSKPYITYESPALFFIEKK